MTVDEASDALDEIKESILALEIKAGLHAGSAPPAGFIRNIYFSVEDLDLRKSLIRATLKHQALWIDLQEAKIAETDPSEAEANPAEFKMQHRILEQMKSEVPAFTEKEAVTGLLDPDRIDPLKPLD